MVTVISNSGPLIALGKLTHLHLLRRLFPTVQMPNAVWEEVVVAGLRQGATEAASVQAFWRHCRWPIIEVNEADAERWPSPATLDRGESHAIVLARMVEEPLLLLDDRAARREVRKLGIPAFGTLGIITRCYKNGDLTLDETELILDETGSRPDIWISKRLCAEVLTGLRDHP